MTARRAFHVPAHEAVLPSSHAALMNLSSERMPAQYILFSIVMTVCGPVFQRLEFENENHP